MNDQKNFMCARLKINELSIRLRKYIITLLLSGSLGTGILAMPNAFSHSGYVIGSISTVIIGIICTYCIHLLLKSHYELCKRKKVICFKFN